MLIRRFPSFGPLGRDVDRVFSGLLREADGLFKQDAALPAINIWEDGDTLFAEAEVPGFKMEDLELEVLDNQLKLKGRRDSALSDNASWLRRERKMHAFERDITLPFDIEVDQVSATLKHGILTISLPKAEVAKARKIEVKVIEK